SHLRDSHRLSARRGFRSRTDDKEDAVVGRRLRIVGSRAAVAAIAGQSIEQSAAAYWILREIVGGAEQDLQFLGRLGIHSTGGVVERIGFIPVLRQICLLQKREQPYEQRKAPILRCGGELELINSGRKGPVGILE